MLSFSINACIGRYVGTTLTCYPSRAALEAQYFTLSEKLRAPLTKFARLLNFYLAMQSWDFNKCFA